jgi:phosphopantothenoylcysteine synthetase/decarboxylase
MIDLVLDHLYLIVTGAGTARRVPGILPQLAQLGPRLVVIPTPNAARVVSVREMVLALPAGSPHRVVESYFDEAIFPSPPFGLVVVAPCSFNSLNKLAAGIADNLALSVVAEAIGRGTPVIVAVSVNVPLWNHPEGTPLRRHAARVWRRRHRPGARRRRHHDRARRRFSRARPA